MSIVRSISTARRAIAGAALCAAILGTLASLAAASFAQVQTEHRSQSRSLAQTLAPAAALAQAPTTADLVVDFDNGHAAVRRVAVAPAATGRDLLLGAGLDVTTSGGAVCAIDGVGCPATDCFCACGDQEDCRYWSYHHGVPDGGWAYAGEGPAEWVLPPGARDGWVWGGARAPVTATASARGVALGFAWLRDRQLPDGGLGAPGLTVEGILSARAAGADLAGWRTGGRGVLDHLAAGAAAYAAESPAQAGKLLAGLAAAGADPRAFAGADWSAVLMATYDPARGMFGASVWDQAWALLGLAAAREPIPAAAVDALAAARAADGGWGFGPNAAETDTDSTALALQALVAAGAPVTGTVVVDALAHLEATRLPGGGWGHGHDGEVAINVNSTAYALQALYTAGEDPAAPRWAGDGGGPVQALLDEQRPDGRFGFDTAPADLVATLQVVPALGGRPLAVRGPGVARRDALAWVRGQQAADGSFEGFNPGATIDAVIALAAAGAEADASAAGGQRPSDYLAAQAAEYAARGPSAAGKLAVGAVALGADPTAFGGVDLVVALNDSFDAATGRFGAGGTWDQAWAILGLAAADASVPAAAVDALVAAASPAGGWGFEAAAEAPDADSTALVLQALAAAGVPSSALAVRQGVLALRALQQPDGGLAGYDGTTSAASTAMAIGGLGASDQDVDGPGWQGAGLGGPTPREALMARQSPAGGFAGFAGPDDPGATYGALLALADDWLPVRPLRPVYLPFCYLPRGGRAVQR